MTEEEKWAKDENGKGGKGKVDVPLALLDEVWYAHAQSSHQEGKKGRKNRPGKGRRSRSDRVPDFVPGS